MDFKLKSEDLCYTAWGENLTESVFTTTAGKHPCKAARISRRILGGGHHHRRIKLQHRLMEEYTVIGIDNSETVVREREWVLGEKVVAEAIPALILEAILELPILKKIFLDSNKGKWGTVLQQVMNLINNATSRIGGFDHDHLLITVDFLSFRVYSCFEEVDESG